MCVSCVFAMLCTDGIFLYISQKCSVYNIGWCWQLSSILICSCWWSQQWVAASKCSCFQRRIIMSCQQLLITCLLYDRIKSWQICKSWPCWGQLSWHKRILSSFFVIMMVLVTWGHTPRCVDGVILSCPQPNIRSSNSQRENFHLAKFDSLSHLLFSAHQSPPEVPLMCPVLAPVSVSVLWRHYYPPVIGPDHADAE